MKRQLGGRLPVHDSIEFVHDQVLPRVRLAPVDGPVAIHPVCSVRKMGLTDKLQALAARCSAQVVTVEDVQCCGFAGDRGFSHPELNAHALRHLRNALPPGCDVGYSSSRTCEIGLSEHAGMPYRSFIALVDACAQPLKSEGP
jgi:D-lactate dehydrogenase